MNILNLFIIVKNEDGCPAFSVMIIMMIYEFYVKSWSPEEVEE